MVASQTSIARPRPDSAEVLDDGSLWLGLAVVGMIAFFWSGLVSLPATWSRAEFSHGYLIAPIALYLFLMQMQNESKAFQRTPLRRGFGVATILFGLGVGLFGNLVHIPDFSVYGLIVCVAGLVLTVMGDRRGLSYWAPIVYLVFMLPLPNFLYWPLSLKLQLLSSQIGVALISGLGVPVFVDGNLIDLGDYRLQVAEACSGLRYLFPLMSFGFLFAVLYKGPIWHKVVLFLSTLPITILMNSIRIGIIGVLVSRYGPGQAEGFLHFFEGWVIFMACVMILYLEAALLQRLTKTPQPVYTMLQLEFASVLSQLRYVRNIKASSALIFACIAILAAGAAWQLSPARAAVPIQRKPLILFPLELGDWRGERKTLDASIQQALNADDYLMVNYTNATTPVSLLVVYYASQTQGGGIHSPAVCLPGSGWEVAKWSTVATGVAQSSGGTLAVNRAVIQKGLARQLVYYWFEERGHSLTNDYAAKAYTALDALTRGRTDGALVRVITPIEPGATAEDADDRLQGFLRLVLPNLPSYVPG